MHLRVLLQNMHKLYHTLRYRSGANRFTISKHMGSLHCFNSPREAQLGLPMQVCCSNRFLFRCCKHQCWLCFLFFLFALGKYWVPSSLRLFASLFCTISLSPSISCFHSLWCSQHSILAEPPCSPLTVSACTSIPPTGELKECNPLQPKRVAFCVLPSRPNVGR